MTKGKIYIGTSGWNYKHWKNNFYPEDLPQKNWLDYYTKKFDTVELNASFYHLPKRETFKNWKEATPDNFKFSVKASKYITHTKKLNDPEEPVENFLKNAKGLSQKLSVTLFQLPPNMNYDKEKLKHFVMILHKSRRYTIEFRNDTWWNDEAYKILNDNNIAFCIFELGNVLSPKIISADFVYLRLHGPGKKYSGSYSHSALSQWAEGFKEWSAKGKDVYCYFDNDENAYAPENALQLKSLINS